MKIRVSRESLIEHIDSDLASILDRILGADSTTLAITDIQKQVMAYILELSTEEINRLFTLTGTISSDNVIDVHFEPTEDFYIKIIKDYYDGKP